MQLAHSFLLECEAFLPVLPVQHPSLPQQRGHTQDVSDDRSPFSAAPASSSWVGHGGSTGKWQIPALCLPEAFACDPRHDIRAHNPQEFRRVRGYDCLCFVQALILNKAPQGTDLYPPPSSATKPQYHRSPTQSICPQQIKHQGEGSRRFCPFLIISKSFLEFTGKNFFSGTKLFEKQ